ncbi:MAG: 6-carboxytetrahydropterin synthase [Spirochaetes bacterium]|nr:6-carboxytetrahydropterin synthase [Spirochaetota bacterium]
MDMYVSPQVSLTWRGSFAAAHSLDKHKGKCSALHGHTYHVSIKLVGKILLEDGMLVDFSALHAIVDAFDHKHLNGLTEPDPPTAEVLATHILQAVGAYTEAEKRLVSGITVTLSESEHTSVTVYAGIPS